MNEEQFEDWRCLCRLCEAPIESAELCEDCAKGNNPFFTCDNAASDWRDRG